MKRIKNGWSLTKKAFGVVRENPGLMWLPVIGGLLAGISFLIFVIPAGIILGSSEEPTTAQYVGAGIFFAIGSYFASYFVIYYNVALAAAADLAFRGQPADRKAGLALARQRRKVIAQWAAVAMVVSMIFNLLRDRGGIAGDIVAGIGAAVWGLITFLIAPVLAFEGLGPVDAIKRSATMFKQKWGEQVTGNIAISAVTGLVMLLALLVGVAGVFALTSGNSAVVVGGGGLIVLALVGVIAAAVISGAARGVFGVALYRYVADGEVVGPFTVAEFESSVRTKGGRI